MSKIKKDATRIKADGTLQEVAFTPDSTCGSDGGIAVKEKLEDLLGERPRKEPLDPRVTERVVEQNLKREVMKK